MMAKSKQKNSTKSGNFIAEWFGHRVWDCVDSNNNALANQSNRICPFLSSAIGNEKRCIKSSGRSSPTGVCTISSDSNGIRQDWLACPYRTLDEKFTILTKAIRLLFSIPDSTEVFIFSGEKIKTPLGKAELKKIMSSEAGRVFIFMADKLGGEIDLPETPASPGAKVDVSVIEVISCDPAGAPSKFGRHLFYEIQTADFHGSPLHAVKELEALCVENAINTDFHANLSENISICGVGVEGPNKSNIFKRTFYQAVLKILLSQNDRCAGFVLILPISVWSSWMKHLGNPNIIRSDSGVSVLLGANENLSTQISDCKSWIFVFDIDKSSDLSPHPLLVTEMIAASASALQEHAFNRTANAAFDSGVIDKYRKSFEMRINAAWAQKNKT